MPEDYRASQVQRWSVSMQRELSANVLVDAAYVGNRADDLLLFANFNQATPNNAAGTIPLQARRPIQEFADITYSFNGASRATTHCRRNLTGACAAACRSSAR
jgi:hypothetical protein